MCDPFRMTRKTARTKKENYDAATFKILCGINCSISMSKKIITN